MYPWEGVMSQALGMGLGQGHQDFSMAMGMSPYSSGNVFIGPPANTTTTSNPIYIEGESTADEFTQLSNHKFHELLAKFEETI